MPKFWRVPLPGQQSNPGSRQDIDRFPDSRTVFWSNPGSRDCPSRPSKKEDAALLPSNTTTPCQMPVKPK